jgi:hypothetical protein
MLATRSSSTTALLVRTFQLLAVVLLSAAAVCAQSDSATPAAAPILSFGKEGPKTEQAREVVLQILRSRNACTDWFQSKDADPFETFQSLKLELDRHGQLDVIESWQPGDILFSRQPYVARSMEYGGPFSTIVLNANGAFYRSQGRVRRVTAELGPIIFRGTRMLTVGEYFGDTLEARIATLLHELGHIIGLLPPDADDLDGKSVRNTNEVLLHCRVDVESYAKEASHAARR